MKSMKAQGLLLDNICYNKGMSEKISTNIDNQESLPTANGLETLEGYVPPESPESPDLNSTPSPAETSSTSSNLSQAEKIAEARQAVEESLRGAKVLSEAGVHQRLPSVESSFQRARRKKEKLPGRPGERRTLAYLRRLENMINTRRPLKEPDTKEEIQDSEERRQRERRLWDASIDSLVVSEEDLPAITTINKEDIIREQRETLEEWANYFTREDNPFPLWFKVYAWDGLSKMGKFDRENKKFRKRDSDTTAPYPKLQPAVLAKTYELIQSQFDSKGDRPGVPNQGELTKLLENGNFAPIYAHFWLEQKAVIPTPEKAEDVHGQWVEYLPGEEEKISAAAEGTPWCIAGSPATAKQYLGPKGPENKAKFLLFHLNNPSTGDLSESACASIRLDEDGKVAEISGIVGGDKQILEDSLTGIVEEKCMSLPGGEEYKKAFADKKELIRLSGKIKNGEELSKEELEFLYEVRGPINNINHASDPKISELRIAYGIENAVQAGVPIAKLPEVLRSKELAHSMDYLLANGVSLDQIIKHLDSEDVVENIEQLMSKGMSIDRITKYINNRDVSKNFERLRSLGASFARLAKGAYYPKKLDELVNLGADINEVIINSDAVWLYRDEVGEQEDPTFFIIEQDLDELISKGAEPEMLKSIIIKQQLNRSLGINDSNIDRILSAGFSIDDIARGADSDDLMSIGEIYEDANGGFIFIKNNNFEIMLDRGADPKILASRIPRSVYRKRILAYRFKKLFGLKTGTKFKHQPLESL